MPELPAALATYMEGLREHDIDKIADTFADQIKFVTPVRRMDKTQTLEFLQALYSGFPH